MGQSCGCGGGGDVATPDTLKSQQDTSSERNIDVSDTKLDEVKVAKIVRTLRRSTCLRLLNVSWTGLSPASVRSICDGVDTESTLATLLFCGNTISDVRPICNMLERNPRLKYLNLSCNAVNREGLRDILRALDGNTHLTILCLGGNSIGGFGRGDASFVTDHLGANRTLRVIDIRGNGVEESILQAMMQRFSASLSLRGEPQPGGCGGAGAAGFAGEGGESDSRATPPSQPSSGSLSLTGVPPNPPPPPRASLKVRLRAAAEAQGADAYFPLSSLSRSAAADQPRRAVYTPDGARVLVCGPDSVVRIWDAALAEEVQQLTGHTDVVSDAVFSGGGAARLVTASQDSTLRIWNAADGAHVASVERRLPVRAMALSTDGTRLVTSSRDTRVCVWDAVARRVLHRLSHPDAVVCVDLSGCGARVVTGCADSVVRLWDAEAGTELQKLDGHSGVWGVFFSHDAATFATCTPAGVRLWDAAAVRETGRVADGGDVGVAAFSPDAATVATGGGDGVVRVFEAASGRECKKIATSAHEVSSLAFSPDGTKIVTCGQDRMVRVLDLATESELHRLDTRSFVPCSG
eukprot:Rhum_TRINITY_DN4956_c0_g1::Rhum_TRINITY_DN4956_c0_g1_i1::g.15990::m.15990